MAPLRWRRVDWLSIDGMVVFTFLGLALAGALPGRATAELITYQNAVAFNSAISGRNTSVVDFDSPAITNPITTLQGLQFGSLPANEKLIATDGRPIFGNGLNTISGTKFLGSDAGELINLNNRSFTISFQSNVSAFGLYFVSDSNNLSPNELGIRVNGATVSIDRNDFTTLPGTGAVGFGYFVGIVDTNIQGILPTVTVFGATNAFPVGIDNIITAVPEPSSILFASLAVIGGLSGRAWKHKRAKRKSKRFLTIVE